MKSGFSKVVAAVGLCALISFSALAGERKVLPTFSLAQLEAGAAGETVVFEDYRDTVLLVNFWATWCPPCVHELPSMQSLHDALDGQPFEILALNMGEDPKMIGKFLERFDPELKFPILLNADRKTAYDWRVRAMPSTMVVDKQGRLVTFMIGAKQWDSEEIVNLIMPLLEE